MTATLDHWIDRSHASREQFFGLLQSGLDLLNQGLTVFGPDLELVAWNQTFFEMLEFPQHFARVGTPFAEFLRYNAGRGEYGTGDIEEIVRERLRIAQAFQPHYTERERPNGKIIAVRGEPLPGKGFITVYTDITAQRRFERMLRDQNQLLEARVQDRTRDLAASAEALHSSENRLRVITDAIPAHIAYCDKDGICRFANLGYARWFGTTKEAVIGRPIRDVVGEDIYAQASRHMERLYATREPVSYEYSRVREGRTEHARSTVLPEFDDSGRMVGFFVLAQDTTEQRRTQSLLAHAQKMEAVGQFTGAIAEDFHHLLTAVLGNLAGLQAQLGAGDAAAPRLAPAVAAAQQGLELAQRLLAFSQETSLADTPIDVGATVAGMAPLLRRTLPEKYRLEVEAPDAPIWVVADPVALEASLINLAVNARDAMPTGGELHVRVTLALLGESSARALELPAAHYAKVQVSDTGVGMDEATAERAFEPFFTTKSSRAGGGLGLAMVYGFAKRSHGAVRLESTPGHGTAVTLWLPCVDAPAAVR